MHPSFCTIQQKHSRTCVRVTVYKQSTTGTFATSGVGVPEGRPSDLTSRSRASRVTSHGDGVAVPLPPRLCQTPGVPMPAEVRVRAFPRLVNSHVHVHSDR